MLKHEWLCTGWECIRCETTHTTGFGPTAMDVALDTIGAHLAETHPEYTRCPSHTA